MDDKVAIGNFRTKLNAEIAAGLLANQHVPFLIQSTEGMLHGPIAPGATIFVPHALAAQAKRILGDAGMIPADDD